MASGSSPPDPVADSAAHERAARLLLQARGSIYAAFDALGCGFDHEAALAYLEGSPGFQALPEDQRGKVTGLVMGFALTAVESVREVSGGVSDAAVEAGARALYEFFWPVKVKRGEGFDTLEPGAEKQYLKGAEAVLRAALSETRDGE